MDVIEDTEQKLTTRSSSTAPRRTGGTFPQFLDKISKCFSFLSDQTDFLQKYLIKTNTG